MEQSDHRLPPITRDMIPKSIEQRTLEAVERIEKIIMEYVQAQNASKVPSQTPKPVQGPKKR